MKLAQILPEANLPVARAPQASVPGGGSYGALARAGASLQQGAADLAVAQERIQKAEDAKRKQLATQEADAAEAALDTSLATTDSDLRVTERDPDRYKQTFTQTAQEQTATTLRSMRTEEGRALLSARLPKILSRAEITAHRHSNALYVERATGLVDQTTADLVTKAGLTPIGDEEAFDDLIARGTRAINNAVPVLGEKVAGERRRALVDAVVTERARRHRDFDPEHFADVADQKYPQMDPKRRDEFKDHARKEVIRLADRDRAERERQEKKIETDHKDFREAIFNDLEQQASQGTGDLKSLDEAARRYRMDGTRYTRIREAITNPKTTPSDPSVAARIGLDVESISPRTTEREIDDLQDKYRRGLPGLSLTDALKYKNQLRSTRMALLDDKKARLKDEHNQAEQELRTMFGFQPGLVVEMQKDMQGDRKAMLFGGFLSQLRARSSLFDGKEAPLVVVEEMRARVTSALGEQAKFNEQEIKAQLLYPDRASLDQAKAQGKIQGALYDQQRRLILQLEELAPPKPKTTDKSGAKRK